MKVSIYRELIQTIFCTIHMIKCVTSVPDLEEEKKVKFEFKKPGFSKLLIFDLDETLIHCKREEYYEEVDEEEEVK